MWFDFRSKASRHALLAGVAVICAQAPILRADETVSVTDSHVRVSRGELSVATMYREMQGRFDPYGNYSAFPSGTNATSVMSMMRGSYRFSKNWDGGLGFGI